MLVPQNSVKYTEYPNTIDPISLGNCIKVIYL